MRPLALLVAGVLHIACNTAPPAPGPLPPAPPTPAPTDAGPPAPSADVYTRACYALRTAGCPEGRVADCAAVMQRADTLRLTRVNAACLAGAQTSAAVRACGGFVKCSP